MSITHNTQKWLMEEFDKESGDLLSSKTYNDYNEALYEFNELEKNRNSVVHLSKSKKELLVESR